jgi:hypothetical protein
MQTKEERNKRRSNYGYKMRAATYNSFRHDIYRIFAQARKEMWTHAAILDRLRRDVWEHRYFKKMNQSYKSECSGYIQAMFDFIDREMLVFGYTLGTGEIVLSMSEEIQKHYVKINNQNPSSGRAIWKADLTKNYTENKYECEKENNSDGTTQG